MFIFFFFKQKTAYEIRPRDWSSDVCSSDLGLDGEVAVRDDVAAADVEARPDEVADEGRAVALGRQQRLLARALHVLALLVRLRLGVAEGAARARLEEHVGARDEADAVA